MKRIVILGSVVIAVIALWTAGWLFVANEARRAIVALGADNGDGAPTLNCASLGIAGYPFRLDITCTGAALVSGDLTATLDELKAAVLVYKLDQVLLFAKTPMTVEDAFTGARNRVTWSSLESSIRLTGSRLARFSLVADNINWADTLAAEALIANAGHLELHLVDIPEKLDEIAHTAALAVVGRLTGLTAPDLQINAGDTQLDAEITRIPDNVWDASTDPDPLRTWQAKGGVLTVTGFKGEDGQNFFDISGQAALDATGHPDGQVVVKSRGVVERFSAGIAPELQGLVLGQPQADGSYSQTLTMKGGFMLSGLMPVAALPPLW